MGNIREEYQAHIRRRARRIAAREARGAPPRDANTEERRGTDAPANGDEMKLRTMDSMLSLYRRHTSKCSHRRKGSLYLKCGCPVWCWGALPNGKFIRRSVSTRNMSEARRTVELWERNVLSLFILTIILKRTCIVNHFDKYSVIDTTVFSVVGSFSALSTGRHFFSRPRPLCPLFLRT